MAITNNDTPKSVPSAHNNVLKSPDNSTEEQIAQNEGGFPAWAILLIVAVCIVRKNNIPFCARIHSLGFADLVNLPRGCRLFCNQKDTRPAKEPRGI
jgi:hypothetical protein